MGARVASNDALNSAIRGNPKLDGMGCTLVVGYFDGEGLRWVSVGDSMLLLYRDRQLHRLNDDHSLGALLDKQARANIITWDEALNSPRRRTLRSALTGGNIALKEVMSQPVQLKHGDWAIIASDGLETLTGDEIASVVHEFSDADPRIMVARLLEEVDERRHEHQDNTTVIAINVRDPQQLETVVVGREGPSINLPDPETVPVLRADGLGPIGTAGGGRTSMRLTRVPVSAETEPARERTYVKAAMALGVLGVLGSIIVVAWLGGLFSPGAPMVQPTAATRPEVVDPQRAAIPNASTTTTGTVPAATAAPAAAAPTENGAPLEPGGAVVPSLKGPAQTNGAAPKTPSAASGAKGPGSAQQQPNPDRARQPGAEGK
jgi:serine/threonine protein phosphatase PrpC